MLSARRAANFLCKAANQPLMEAAARQGTFRALHKKSSLRELGQAAVYNFR